jgi:hypothetical protein
VKDIIPRIHKGNSHKDVRGFLKFNNDFDLSAIKRVYSIQNNENYRWRGWQGHLIEQRWFQSVGGDFNIKVIKMDGWPNLDKTQVPLIFNLQSNKLDILHIPAGYMTCIEQLDMTATLVVYANFSLGEVKDEYRLDLNHFNKS